MQNRQIHFLKSETQRYAVIGILFGLLFPIIATTIRIIGSNLPISFLNIKFVQSTDSLLWIVDTAPLFLGLFAAFAGLRQDNLQITHEQLKLRERELENTQNQLEQRVEERTHELVIANRQMTRRAEQLKLVADVAKSATSIQFVDQLLRYITELISQSFNIYHIGIFLLDEQNQYARLEASNTEGGLVMLKRGYRLKVGEQGIVGFVTSRGQPRIAVDVGQDAVFFDNPDLPNTRSELALPLKISDKIIGALDLQSTEERAFKDEDLSVLAILADQVAIAIQNARSAERAKRALLEAEIATKQLSGEAWKGYAADKAQSRGYRYDGVKPEPINKGDKFSQDKDILSVPVQLRGQTIGRLKLKGTDANRSWTEDERAIIDSTAERVALAMESARLLDEAQKRATRESFLSEIGTKLGASFQLDSILRDTVEELGQTLKGSTVSFQLVNPSSKSTIYVDTQDKQDE